MRKISKTEEPYSLTSWRTRNPDKHRYEDLSSDTRQSIREKCLEEQKGLCAFCCTPVSGQTSHNAHLQSRVQYPQRALCFDNIVASCQISDHCGIFQGTRALPLTPLMAECETELTFSLSGRVNALSDRAQQTIDALNLNAPSLCQRRRQAIRDLELSPDFHPVEDITNWDTELLEVFIAAYEREQDGKLVAYAPVLVNIARQYLP